jgi:lipopolysaccharide/colanic/teichoic acid biosynthesis glycosyltransferase
MPKEKILKKKIIVTGASSLVGTKLIEALEKLNLELILIERDEKRIKKIFSKHKTLNYNQLDLYKGKINAIIHLALMNNNIVGSNEDFQKANVELFKKILLFSKKNNVFKVINLTSFNIFYDKEDPYSVSEHDQFFGGNYNDSITLTNIICPFVYSVPYKGKLSFLNKLPTIIRVPLWDILSAFKPLVNLESVIREIILQLESNNKPKDILLADNKDNNFSYLVFKKLTNLAFAFSVLIVFLLPMIFIWLFIVLTDKAPGIFKQTRLGKNESHYKLFKFRTMKLKTPNVETHKVSASDITKIGSVLRSTKFDELLQIFNILAGDMDLIGPRPCLPKQIELINFRREKGIYQISPGITGYAQVNQIDMSSPKILAEWDSRYLKMRSVFLDLLILKQTFLGKGRGDKISKNNY